MASAARFAFAVSTAPGTTRTPRAAHDSYLWGFCIGLWVSGLGSRSFGLQGSAFQGLGFQGLGSLGFRVPGQRPASLLGVYAGSGHLRALRVRTMFV